MSRRSNKKTSRPTAIGLVASLGVSDIDRSVLFYKEFFGFELHDSYEADGRMAWCWLKTGGADLMLQQLTADQQITLNPAIGQSWVIYIRPDDIQATHARLKKAGFPVSDIAATSYGASEFFLTDPDGYELWISVPSANGLMSDAPSHCLSRCADFPPLPAPKSCSPRNASSTSTSAR